MRSAWGEAPSPFPKDQPRHSLSYAEARLDVTAESLARDYIDWLRWRRDDR